MKGTGFESTSCSRQRPAARAVGVRVNRLPRAGLVSVIIPAYNAAATIERTISSVSNQSYLALEVLVVDDGSTDETALLVQQMADLDHRIRLLRKTNGGGPASARNYGIEHASGEFIAPLDADDLWHPEKIKKQVALMQNRGDEVGLIYTWARAIDEQDRVIADIAPFSLRGNVYAALIIKNFVPSGAPLVRRNCVDEVGGYDVTLAARGAHSEDFKFNLDIAERYDFDLVPEFLKGYRFRAGNRSSATKVMLRSRELIVREARARHPELPDKLFRWAAGHYHREFGLSFLDDGYISTGTRLLLGAVVEDPLATLKLARRAIARVSRKTGLIEFVRASIHTSDRIVNRKFLEVDPTAFCGRPSAQWSRKRLAYITELRVERGPAMAASVVREATGRLLGRT